MLSKIDPKQLTELTIVLTESCNMNCEYCYQTFNNKVLQFSDFIKTIKKIELNKIEKPLLIELFGGEPIQEKTKEIFNDVVGYFLFDFPKEKKHLIHFKINTNAKYLDIDFLKILKQLNLQSKFKLYISFDGLWQNKRDKILNNIINNIRIYLNTCFSINIKLKFSVSGNELNFDKNALIKNYLFLRKIFPISNQFISYYLIREPWEWTEEKVENYLINFKNFCNWSLNELQKGSKIEPFYFLKFREDYSQRLGCNFGISKFTILPGGQISACSLDNDFRIEEGIELNKIYENCKDCEIYNHCDKTCPKKIFYRNENNKNLLCELKKEEYKIFKLYENKAKEIINKSRSIK